jgi:hypothetical protein
LFSAQVKNPGLRTLTKVPNPIPHGQILIHTAKLSQRFSEPQGLRHSWAGPFLSLIFLTLFALLDLWSTPPLWTPPLLAPTFPFHIYPQNICTPGFVLHSLFCFWWTLLQHRCVIMRVEQGGVILHSMSGPNSAHKHLSSLRGLSYGL